MDYLYDALENKKNINLCSSVYIELKSNNPSITIWINDNNLNITSTREYKSKVYYEKNSIKLFEIDDISTIKKIYDYVSIYFYSYEEIINNLINILNSNYKLKLK